MTIDSWPPVETIGMFCGSRGHAVFARQAYNLGWTTARRGCRVVFGAGSAGLMGAVAKGAHDAGGFVEGIAPVGLFEHERAEPALWPEFLVNGMPARKQRIYEPSDAFFALPGGFGTGDELFEAATMSQLGLHGGAPRKRIVLLNWKSAPHRPGFWDALIQHLDHIVDEGFLSPEHRGLIQVADSAEEALDLLGVSPIASAADAEQPSLPATAA